MSESTGAAADAGFTGERIIPGLVDTDLMNEHLARYRFAAWALGKLAPFRKDGAAPAVLDAGCGAGYGTVEFPAASTLTAIDIAAEALALARRYGGERSVGLAQASCEQMPFADSSFDLVAAFEVIEHLTDWPQLLAEARRVLRPEGLLLVSTPNKSYYAESRASAGPNPFHVHEFEYEEFADALGAVFPFVRIWTQNHAGTIVFAPAEAAETTGGPGSAEFEASAATSAAEAHFLVAACSASEIPFREVFAWLPAASNVLREREMHIAKLEDQLRELRQTHSALQEAHVKTERELRERNHWAETLNAEIRSARGVIAELEGEAEQRLGWIRQLEGEIAGAGAEIRRLTEETHALNRTIVERTSWAHSLEEEKDQAINAFRELEAEAVEGLQQAEQRLAEERSERAHQLQLIAHSRWVRIGRRLGVGPELGADGKR